MAAAAAAALVASGSSSNGGSDYSGGSPPPPVGFAGPDVPHCSVSSMASPLVSQVQNGVDFLRNDMGLAQCANDHPDGPRGKSGCSMMYSGHGARLYMCGTFGYSVSCQTAADAVESMIKDPDCLVANQDDTDAFVGGENFVKHGSPLYVTVSRDEGRV